MKLPFLFVLLAAASVFGQSPAGGKTQTTAPVRGDASGWMPVRTAWGVPDLQGVWDFRTITPLQRPKEFGDRQFMTEDEAAKFEEAESVTKGVLPPEEARSNVAYFREMMREPARTKPAVGQKTASAG